MSPCQIQDAYRLPSQVAGTGRTVAIVDAYDNPNAESDLAIYRTQYGLPACTTANGCFKKLNQTGAASSYPTGDPGWGIEISLDLDAVSAACPLCHITLVEANSSSTLDLDVAEDTAAAQSPTSISNSWGAGEFAGENTLDGHFTHPGIPITVSTGDGGYGTAWPAASPTVTAVGGTELTQDSSTRGWSETVWSGAGSGCSTQEAKPIWQTDSGCPSNRTIADVSALAGSPGLAIYDTYGTGGTWLDYGGTSLAAPLVGAVYALAYPDYTSAVTYTHAASLFDITSGSTGSCGGQLPVHRRHRLRRPDRARDPVRHVGVRLRAVHQHLPGTRLRGPGRRRAQVHGDPDAGVSHRGTRARPLLRLQDRLSCGPADAGERT